jgi:hypothetical protein
VFKLYRPVREGHAVFACRQCHDLTYQSAQQHDQRLYSLLKMPDSVLARYILEGRPAWKMLAVEAGYIRLGLIPSRLPKQQRPARTSRKETGNAFAITPAFLDMEITFMATQQMPHPRHGFRDVLKAIKLGYRRLGLI